MSECRAEKVEQIKQLIEQNEEIKGMIKRCAASLFFYKTYAA